MIIKPTKFDGIFEAQKGMQAILLTKNLVPGCAVYGESLFYESIAQGSREKEADKKEKEEEKEEGKNNGSQKSEYREWIASRSKLCSFILRGADQIAIRPGSTVLYLGASTGTTVSHVSDIVGYADAGKENRNGFIFAVEYAPRVARELVFLAEQRNNIAPILGDAARPDTYISKISGVDVVYQDVAQRNQVEIFLKNTGAFLKKGGFGLLAIKARSINVAEKPDRIFENVKKQLIESGLLLIDHRRLDPFQKDHAMFLVKRK